MGRIRPHITVVGLGPAGTTFLSNGVAALMANARQAFLRTSRHPAAEQFPGVESFDRVYEAADTFEAVYRGIVEELVAAATQHAPDPVVYAVPGSPLVAERTVEFLRVDERVDLTIVPGLSFLDLAWERLGIDPLHEGVRLIDAENFAQQAAGERGPFLVAQCWSRTLLSEVKLSGDPDDEAARPDVLLLHHLGLDDEQIVAAPWWELDRTIEPDHLTSLYIPNRALGAVEREMDRLVDLVLTLREKCPWDREQTHGSLMPHLVEESYEVLDAIAAVDRSAPPKDGVDSEAYAHLQEELGDLLFQIVFHSRLAEEAGQFTLSEVAHGVHDKLVHRHPHVFGDVDADSPEQVVANWEEIKKEEKGRTSVTEGIPSHLPALMLASKLQRKAISVGLPPAQWPGNSDPLENVAALQALLAERQEAGADTPLDRDGATVEQHVGDLLFTVANLARMLGVDPEQALRASALQLRDGVMEREGVHNPIGATD